MATTIKVEGHTIRVNDDGEWFVVVERTTTADIVHCPTSEAEAELIDQYGTAHCTVIKQDEPVVLVFSGDNGTNVILYDNEQHAIDRLRECVEQWLREDHEYPAAYDMATLADLQDICDRWDMDVVITTLGKPGDE